MRETIRRLETRIRRYERRYECTSADKSGAVRCGDAKETAAISRWLMDYRTLHRLRDKSAAGATIGTRTRGIGRSTIGGSETSKTLG